VKGLSQVIRKPKRGNATHGSNPPPGLKRRLSLARGALFWERLWPALWPVFGVAGGFLALALLDILPQLPGWLHAGVLLGVVVAFGIVLWRAVKALLGLPPKDAARRRLEVDSGLAHRPLFALDDELATDSRDRAGAALWEAHRLRLLAQAARLRVAWPRPGLVRLDPLALRVIVVLFLVAGVAAGKDDWDGRLIGAVTPRLAMAQPSLPASLSVWINPPAYTGQPPLFLEPGAGEAGKEIEVAVVPVPTGSTFLAQVEGGQEVPRLTFATEEQAFEPVAANVYKLSREIEIAGLLTVGQGERALGTWRIDLLPDRAPEIEFLSPPMRTERLALRLEYGAEDDYGLNEVTAELRRVDKPEEAPIVVELLLPGAGRKTAENASYHDLTPHPWAGLAVDVTLSATDALGQIGRSDPARTVLPERIFNHPVARALVELRKQLTLDPDGRLPVVRGLSELYRHPDHFFHDLVVALAIRFAERRLIYDSRPQAVPQVQQLLWDTALHIEEGELAIAERDLREIYEKLMQALNDGAPESEIDELMDQLSEALERYMEALAEQLREQLARGGEPQPLPPNAQLIPSDRLQELLDRARELAKSGSRDAARDLLAQLQSLLENLRAAPFAQMMQQEGEGAWQMMNDLESMMQRQQELLDRSYERSQRMPGNEDGQGDGEGERRSDRMGENQRDALAQEALRRELGEMMRKLGNSLGEIPQPLGRAEQAMRDARRALEEGDPGQAVDPQTQALDQLMQGMQAMAESFMEQMGNSQAPGSGPLSMSPGQSRDPLGRNQGEFGTEALEGVQIPDEMELRRAREILNELRRRRGQRSRPPLELDYIDRLLQQF
jgi:uncharacterized protein (TIGR02302 family)